MNSDIYSRYPVISGVVVALFLLLIGIGAMLALAVTPLAGGAAAPLLDVINFDRLVYSIKSASLQASLSVVFSILLAIPISIVLARRQHWPGMGFLVMSISLAMVLPTTVAAMGLLALWGRSGMMATLCGEMYDFNIYGLQGVVLAHMMLNIPLAVRVMMPLLQAVPANKWRLCGHLGMNTIQRFRYGEWPVICGAIPGLASLIFLLCFTSFALVLMLGGGPKVTTLEVEIYSMVRFDFNMVGAAGLSLIQFLLTAVVVAISALFGGMAAPTPISGYDKFQPRLDLTRLDRIIDQTVITLAVIVIALPVVMVGYKGINKAMFKLLTRPQFWDALLASVTVALISAGVVTLLALNMASAKAGLTLPHRFQRIYAGKFLRIVMDQGVMLYLVIPSVVLGTAAFILLRARGDVFGYAFGVVILANTLLALPFAYRLLETRMTAVLNRHDRLAANLGIDGIARLRVLTLPVLRRDIGLVAGLSAALSFGDFGVIALFANADFRTLPWLLYQLSGKYAADEANALALLLMGLTVLLFFVTRVVIEWGLRGRHA